MATTVWLDRPSHDRLVELKAHFGVASIGAVIRALLDQPAETAVQIYQRRKKEVDAVCRKHKVERLVAFGSRARGDARVDSDLDLAVVMAPEHDLLDFVEIKEQLEHALVCPTDIIPWPQHGSRIMRHIEAEGVDVYRRRPPA